MFAKICFCSLMQRLFFIHFLFQCFFLFSSSCDQEVHESLSREHTHKSRCVLDGCRRCRHMTGRQLGHITSGVGLQEVETNGPPPVSSHYERRTKACQVPSLSRALWFCVSLLCVVRARVCVWIMHMCFSHQTIPEGSIAGHCRESQEERTAEGPDVSAHGA